MWKNKGRFKSDILLWKKLRSGISSNLSSFDIVD